MSLPCQLGLSGRRASRGVCVRLALEMAFLTAALIALFGCGQDAPPATVEGTLRRNGKPLDNCLITFLPEPGPQARGSRATGLTDQHGAYRLRFDNQQEGAAVGRHRVMVQDLSMSTGVLRRDNGSVDADVQGDSPPPPVRPSRVPEQYASPTGTLLRQEVQPGHQVIDLDIR